MKLLQKFKLSSLHNGNTTEYFRNRRIFAKVVDCYDGDTCTVVTFVGSVPFKMKIRLMGIDTAELPRRKDGSDKSREEALMAKKAKDFLSEKILNKCVMVEVLKCDKWGGRYLGHIYNTNLFGHAKGESLNKILLDKGLAVPYNGEKKDTDWVHVYSQMKDRI